jgi:hypothetical protein
MFVNVQSTANPADRQARSIVCAGRNEPLEFRLQPAFAGIAA